MQINALMSAYSLYAPRSLGAAAGSAQTSEAASTKASQPTRQPIVDAVSFSTEALAQLESAETLPSQLATPSAQSLAAVAQPSQVQGAKPPPAPQKTDTNAESGEATELSEEEQKQVDSLKARDREVRQHEQAHVAAAGGYVTGGPTYSYQRGPDGKRYAIGGEVNIDTSPVEGDPEATAQKARVVRSAALAPAEPSSQDLRVAASATKMEQEAIAQLRQSTSPSGNAASAAPATVDAYGATAPQQPRFLNVVA